MVGFRVRRRLSPFGLVPLAFLASCGAKSEETATSTDEVTARVETRSKLPLPEISGLARRSVEGRTSFVAVSDRTPTLLTFALDARRRVESVHTIDLSSIFGTKAPQWEAVATDGAGRVALLAEGSGTVTFLGADLRPADRTIHLEIPPEHPLAEDWAEDDNARGEGLLLLRNGHLLVVKEKAPAVLVEFAPAGASAQGYTPGDAASDVAFPLPDAIDSTMIPVHYWTLKSHDARRLGDLSEIAVDSDGRLALLSDQGRRLVRPERTLGADEDKIDVDDEWKLPSSITKPEGLVFDGARAIVASDGADASKDALFVLEKL